MTAIFHKHAELGGIAGFLGAPTSLELPCGPLLAGRCQDFAGGSIYWLEGVGACEVHGAIRAKWRTLGGEGGALGFPRTDERLAADGVGRASWFQGGVIHWHPQLGAWELHGFIARKYASIGGPASPLGYPTSDERSAPSGGVRFNTFERGAIYWTPGIGAREVHGSIYAKWLALGLGASALGYPRTDERPATSGGGRVSRFQNGGIAWTQAAGATVVP